MPEETPTIWDLSDLYSGIDDPRLEAAHAESAKRARAFEERFRGRIAAADCSAETLAAAMAEYEAILRGMVRPLVYASLMFEADTSDPKRGALLQKSRLDATALNQHLIFFDLEIGAMPEGTYRALADDPRLAAFRHYLDHERLASKHHLSEAEEKIVDELSNTGIRALTRLFDEVTARMTFRVETKEGDKELNQSEVLALLYEPDREVRRAAAEALTAGLREETHVLSYLFNQLLQHKATMDRLRRYDYPEQSRHEANEIEPEAVANVVEVVTGAYATVAEYYDLKRRLMGVDSLTHYDRYAPLAKTETQIPWDEAREIVLAAFGEFSPRMRELAEPFFTRRWIDAALRPGKGGGAFCNGVSPDLHPYVFMNYTGRPRDVMTLAHELGHALHGVLAAPNVHYLDYHPSLPLAETASVFAEMLVFESLQQRLEDPAEKLALLAGKIEDTFATSFRQITMFRFEQKAHQLRRAGGEQTPEAYDAIWQSTMQEMFGGSLTLGDDHARWWTYIPHVFTMPFYVYAYAFGELLVLALYARYRREGAPFVERYLEFLSAGGSQRPSTLLSGLGIDIMSKEFWQGGADLIGEMVTRARRLAGEAGLVSGD